jgi:hypothetical protein
MRVALRSRLAAAAAGAMVVSISVAGGASAKPFEKGEFHDEFAGVIEDFCEVPGFTVEFEAVVDGRFKGNSHGPDGLVYFMEHVRVTQTTTNPANGRSMTEVVSSINKDLRVTDHGDGTLTVLVLATGNATLYGPNGKAIARNPGQIRFELLVDDGGTPTDPTDDEVIEELGLVKGSTGRSDDFCTAALEAIA